MSIKEQTNQITYGQCLEEMSEKNGTRQTMFIPDSINRLIEEFQERFKAENGRHISKEKVFFKLSVAGFKELLSDES